VVLNRVHGTRSDNGAVESVTGRTVCGKTARTGLWGSRWEAAGSTRILAPQAAWTARPALAQVHRAKSPITEIACLSPYLGDRARWDRPASALVGSSWVKSPAVQVPCLSPYLGAPPAWTAQPALGQVHRAKTFGRPNFVSVPIFGRPAGLDRPAGASSGPPGQESGRPNSVSVPIFGPGQISQCKTSKAALW